MDEDEIEEGQFEGISYRSSCPHCDEMNEEENDIRGKVIACLECGRHYRVVGD